jgi:hypothetical protein
MYMNVLIAIRDIPNVLLWIYYDTYNKKRQVTNDLS